MTAIQLTGTSGAGKSHTVRSFLEWVRASGGNQIEKEHVVGRTAPVGYNITLKGFKRPVHLMGSYEAPTGGCDTIKDVVKVFDLIQARYDASEHVIFEGLFVMNMVRGPILAEELYHDLVILQLTTPLAACFSAIDARRAEKGARKLYTKDNTINNFTRAENYCKKMRGAGAKVIQVKREDALELLISVLKQGDRQF